MTASTEYYIQFVSVVARGDGLGVSVVAGDMRRRVENMYSDPSRSPKMELFAKIVILHSATSSFLIMTDEGAFDSIKAS